MEQCRGLGDREERHEQVGLSRRQPFQLGNAQSWQGYRDRFTAPQQRIERKRRPTVHQKADQDAIAQHSGVVYDGAILRRQDCAPMSRLRPTHVDLDQSAVRRTAIRHTDQEFAV